MPAQIISVKLIVFVAVKIGRFLHRKTIANTIIISLGRIIIRQLTPKLINYLSLQLKIRRDFTSCVFVELFTHNRISLFTKSVNFQLSYTVLLIKCSFLLNGSLEIINIFADLFYFCIVPVDFE